MKVQFRIALACGFGALIGTFIALQFSSYFSWIGFAVGGLFGYLSYNYKEVGQVATSTAKQMFAKREIDWQRIGNFIKLGIKSFLAGVNLTAILGAPFVVVLLLAPVFDFKLGGEDRLGVVMLELLGAISFGLTLFMLGISVGAAIAIPKYADRRRNQDLKELLKNEDYVSYVQEFPSLNAALQLNVVTVYGFWVWYGLYKLGCRIVNEIAAIPFKQSIVAVGQFFKTVFIGIHSDIRLLCGCDAAIGSIIGFLAGYVIVGFVAGAVIGLLNYEIVSKRILKLIPQQN